MPRCVPIIALGMLLATAGCRSDHARSSQAKVDRTAAAFGSLVRHRYPNENGLWACRRVIYPPREIACWAELHRGARYRGVYARTPAPPAAPTFSDFSTTTWTRRWRPLPFRVAHLFDTSLRGSAIVNGPVNGTDWAFLIGGAYAAFDAHRLPGYVYASDGPSDLPDLAIRFRCIQDGASIVCTNGAGDALRLRPSSARFRRCGRGLVVASNYDCFAARAVEHAYRRRPARSMRVESKRMEMNVKCVAKGKSVVCRSIYADGLVVRFPR
jgi:hypothetical protein